MPNRRVAVQSLTSSCLPSNEQQLPLSARYFQDYDFSGREEEADRSELQPSPTSVSSSMNARGKVLSKSLIEIARLDAPLSSSSSSSSLPSSLPDLQTHSELTTSSSAVFASHLLSTSTHRIGSNINTNEICLNNSNNNNNNDMEDAVHKARSISSDGPVITAAQRKSLQEYVERSKKAAKYMLQISHSRRCGGICGSVACVHTTKLLYHVANCPIPSSSPFCLAKGCQTTKKLLEHAAKCAHDSSSSSTTAGAGAGTAMGELCLRCGMSPEDTIEDSTTRYNTIKNSSTSSLRSRSVSDDVVVVSSSSSLSSVSSTAGVGVERGGGVAQRMFYSLTAEEKARRRLQAIASLALPSSGGMVRKAVEEEGFSTSQRSVADFAALRNRLREAPSSKNNNSSSSGETVGAQQQWRAGTSYSEPATDEESPGSDPRMHEPKNHDNSNNNSSSSSSSSGDSAAVHCNTELCEEKDEEEGKRRERLFSVSDEIITYSKVPFQEYRPPSHHSTAATDTAAAVYSPTGSVDVSNFSSDSFSFSLSSDVSMRTERERALSNSENVPESSYTIEEEREGEGQTVSAADGVVDGAIVVGVQDVAAEVEQRCIGVSEARARVRKVRSVTFA